MSENTVNIPLLRKAVEWAEAEAQKPPVDSEWSQEWWRTLPDYTPEERAEWEEASGLDYSGRCGTAYCIAGYVAELHGWDWDAKERDPLGPAMFASDLLGLSRESWFSGDDHLFDCENTIEDVRRIAEDIAGERL